jgi:hypothetical protein
LNENLAPEIYWKLTKMFQKLTDIEPYVRNQEKIAVTYFTFENFYFSTNGEITTNLVTLGAASRGERGDRMSLCNIGHFRQN